MKSFLETFSRPVLTLSAAALHAFAGAGFAQDCPNQGRSHVAGPDDDISTVDCAQLGFTF
jgi:hypothetical protein